MNFKSSYKILALLITIVMCTISCSSGGDGEDPKLLVSETTVSFEPKGGTSEEIAIEANSTWSVSNSATSWLQLSKASGNDGTTTTTLIAASNETGFTRSVVLTVTADNGLAKRITVTQTANLYPSYNLSPKPADATGMSSTAVQLGAKMNLGINFGNTMESQAEGDWVSNKITESYVKFLKQTGFNAVRIPCAWSWSHLSDPEKAKIDPAWLNRVKEVVGWCVNNDMYVLLNIHWDGGWLDENINKAKQEVTNAKQKAFWEQIATTMRDFDEHLMFASANEPPAKDAEQMAILNSYHETFIKAVRSTGGRNSYRVLVVQGPTTSADLSYTLMNTLPKDEVPNRLMVEVHNYTPAQFCILDEDASWGKMFYYWGMGNHSTIEPDRNATWGEEDAIISEFKKMKEKFVDKGIPVLLGEYAAFRKTASSKNVPKDLDMHNKSIDYWTTFVTKQAKAHGILPFYWEQGSVLDRKNNKVLDQGIIDALILGTK